MTRVEHLQEIERREKALELRRVQMGALLISTASKMKTPVLLADDVGLNAKVLAAAILVEVLNTRPQLKTSLNLVFEWPRSFVLGEEEASSPYGVRALNIQRRVWAVCNQTIAREKLFFPKYCPPESLFTDPWPQHGEEMLEGAIKPDVSINWWFAMAHRLIDHVPPTSVWIVSPWTASHRGIHKALRHICAPKPPPVTTTIFTGAVLPYSHAKGLTAEYTYNFK